VVEDFISFRIEDHTSDLLSLIAVTIDDATINVSIIAPSLALACNYCMSQSH